MGEEKRDWEREDAARVSTRVVQLIYNRREMTILPLELDEITGPATARKNGRPRSKMGSIGRPDVAKLWEAP